MNCEHGNGDNDEPCGECAEEEQQLANALTTCLEANDIIDPDEQVQALLYHAVRRSASAGYTLIDFQEMLETTYAEQNA